jgi:hypothetical protein
MNDLKAGAGQVRGNTLVVLPLNMPVTTPGDNFLILSALISTLTTRDGHASLAWHLRDVHSSVVLRLAVNDLKAGAGQVRGNTP